MNSVSDGDDSHVSFAGDEKFLPCSVNHALCFITCIAAASLLSLTSQIPKLIDSWRIWHATPLEDAILKDLIE